MSFGPIRHLFGRIVQTQTPKRKRRNGSREPNPELLVRLPPAERPERFERTLAAAVIVGDEVGSIREWVAFHLTVGFEMIHVYTNWLDRADATRREIEDFVEAGLVTITPWPDIFNLNGPGHYGMFQNYCYAHAITTNRGRVRWLALIDADEFLYSPVEDDLKSVLRRYEERPAVAVFWVNFGSNGHLTPPEGLVIDNYTRAAADGCLTNRQYKSIVQPHRITGVFSPHRYVTDEADVCAYSEIGEPLGNRPYERNVPSGQILRLNHYCVKSEAEFEARLNTGWAAMAPHIREQKMRNRENVEAATVEDHGIRRFAERTRALMAAGPRRRSDQDEA